LGQGDVPGFNASPTTPPSGIHSLTCFNVFLLIDLTLVVQLVAFITSVELG
jgi:hypothetical protein